MALLHEDVAFLELARIVGHGAIDLTLRMSFTERMSFTDAEDNASDDGGLRGTTVDKNATDLRLAYARG